MYHQVVQLLTGARLIARPQGASIKELMDHLEVSRKTVYRLFEALEELGYILFPDKDGKEARYYLNKEIDKMRYWQPLPNTSFTIEDRVLLDFIFRKVTDNPSIAKLVGELRNKLALSIADCGYTITKTGKKINPISLAKPVIVTDIPVMKKGSSIQDRVLTDLLEAVREKAVCTVSYESFSAGNIRTYQVHPLALFDHNGGLYAFVFQPYYGKVIILAVERIKNIELTNEHFKIPADFDAEKRLADPFGIVLNDEPFLARIKFDEEQAPYIQERCWPEDAEIEELDNGEIILSLKTAGAYELKKWILGFAESAELLEPEWLRAELIEDIRKVSRLYSR